MPSSDRFCRSPELMSPSDTALVVVDVQDKLIRLLPGWQRIVWNIRRLLDGAKILRVPTFATEQYPQGLGGTIGELAERLDRPPAKLTFSCAGCEEFCAQLEATSVHKLLLVGIETHVCLGQTAFDLMAAGYRIYVAADATGARHAIDHETALRRLDSAGATLTTTEAALFEWCRVAGTPEFRQLSQLVRESPPE